MTNPPASIPGTRQARVSDCPRLAWQLVSGLRRSGRYMATWLGRMAVQLLSVALVISFPLTYLLSVVRVLCPWCRQYMTVSRDAVLMVSATPRGWSVGNHTSTRPGAGKELRDIAIPALLEVADREGITIRAVAGHELLAETYQREVPGLRDVGRGLRGRRLRRDPSPIARERSTR